MRAADRQREELQRQLLHAQRLDALGTLAGGIAHDLNNILVPVLGLTEYLQAGMAQDDPNRGILDVIRSAGERARNLVGQILTFSRREHPDRRDLCLAMFLQETMSLIRASVPATIKIEERFEPVPLISADPGQLQQVLLNLVLNSVQAIGANKGSITLSASYSHDGPLGRPGGPPQSWVCISVRDSGCGMNDATLKRMFEPFFTTKPAGQGTGLGLSVVHGIVTAHGGAVQVTSSIGNGTCVDVFLPATSSTNQPLPACDRASEAAE
jgi:signal transduction histidine kinase